ncbi:MAG: exopolyphosphatase [Cyclobacteriaceae bacterium]|nr:exopolyphosphatase [Cyclobacteriaceae bacterium]UYN86381.1 MAG: exopolyphosphatase [Cyclobacteriaceae bacterium]
MNNRLAIIDLGTNTFHLLIAEKLGDSFHIAHRDRQAVKIGKGGINENVIPSDGLERAIQTLNFFKKKIDSLQITNVFAFGTSALRNATNNEEVLAKIKAETGIHVTLISGDQEAEFIYHGVCSAVNLGDTKSLIIDIGGGSVEFIVGDENQIFWKKSIEIGAQRLLELFHKSDPIALAEISKLNHHFQKTLSPLFEALTIYKPEIMVGSSGTFDTLSDIYCIQHSIFKNDDDRETPLSLEGFNKIYNELLTKDRIARLAMPGMIEMRVDMIVVACCLIRYILDHHPITNIRVSSYSLKEGALIHVSKNL